MVLDAGVGVFCEAMRRAAPDGATTPRDDARRCQASFRLFNFSNQQGSWRKAGDDGAKGVLLAFVYNPDNTLQSTARIEIDFHTVGSGCREIAGSLEVRTFEDGEDPLDPSTDTGEPIATDTFHGRRVHPPR